MQSPASPRFPAVPPGRAAVTARAARRRFLRGAGGVLVGLPFLPSLEPRRAFGQEPAPPGQRNFYALLTYHGGALDSAMFPAQSLLTQQRVHAPTGHTIRWGELTATSAGGDAVLSQVLRAPASRLTPRLLRKLNVIRGLDCAMHVGHCRGAMFGNFADTNGAGRLGLQDRPTIDQIMAWSPSFYPRLEGVRQRSMVYGPSWGYANTQAQSGDVQPMGRAPHSQALFDRLFVPGGQTPAPAQRPPIVDRVLESYRRLRDGDRRLSGDDRRRLDNHMSMLAEVQRKLTVSQVQARCGDTPRPTDRHTNYVPGGSGGADMEKMGSLMNDVFVAAFACGASRIATVEATNWQQPLTSANWHQDIAHQYARPESQALLNEYYRRVFRFVFLDLAAKLDAVESAPGRTLLDDSLLVWTQEAGMDTHWQVSVPVVTAGGAGGALRPGTFIDYRDLQSPHVIQLGGGVPADVRTQRHGLLYNQFLATALQAMGVTRPEFERWGHRGYGAVGYGTVAQEFPPQATRNYYGGPDSRHFQSASDPLPVFMA